MYCKIRKLDVVEAIVKKAVRRKRTSHCKTRLHEIRLSEMINHNRYKRNTLNVFQQQYSMNGFAEPSESRFPMIKFNMFVFIRSSLKSISVTTTFRSKVLNVDWGLRKSQS